MKSAMERVHRRVVEHADELPERLLVLGPVEVEELHLLRRDLVDSHRAHLVDAMEDLMEVVLGHRAQQNYEHGNGVVTGP